jgi:tetratricopeptide (TPR) repeat protein
MDRTIGTWIFAAIIGAGVAACGDAAISADKGDEAKSGARPSELETRINKLIEQLGAEDFAAREKAQAELGQLGLEAFDALHAAQNHHDPEIALRSRYLVRSMSVHWFSESDSPDVVRILKGYGDLGEGERRNRMDLLATLESQQGIIPLCRLSRFETIDPLAKYAALKIMELAPPNGETDKASLAKAISGVMGGSKRPAAAWLRLFARTLTNPADTLADWDRATQDEHSVLAKNPERTSGDIVRDLYRFQVELLKRLKRDDEAIAVTRRTFALLDGTAEQVQEVVDWLMQRKAWPVVLEVADKFPKTFADNAQLLYCLAETQQQLGQTEKAEEAAQRALALSPENLDEHLRIADLLEQVRGLHTWAEREYREVLKTVPAGTRPDFKCRFYLSELLHDQLKELSAAEVLQPVCDLMKKDEAAKTTCEESGRPPESVVSRMNFFYACHFHELHNVAKEKQHLALAIASDPTDADVLIGMYRLPDPDPQWLAKTKESIEEVTKKFRAQIAELQAQVELIGNEQSKASTETLLSIECNQYAWLVGNTLGDYDDALKMSHKSLELRPNYAGYLDTLGRCYYAKGDLAKAVKYQSQAVKLNAYSGQIRRQLDLFRKEAVARGIKLPDAEGTQP